MYLISFSRQWIQSVELSFFAIWKNMDGLEFRYKVMCLQKIFQVKNFF